MYQPVVTTYKRHHQFCWSVPKVSSVEPYNVLGMHNVKLSLKVILDQFLWSSYCIPVNVNRAED